MIWEVDEDCDGMVSWLEFQNMYTRCEGAYGRCGSPPRCHALEEKGETGSHTTATWYRFVP
jgi:hypothetical protein